MGHFDRDDKPLKDLVLENECRRRGIEVHYLLFIARFYDLSHWEADQMADQLVLDPIVNVDLYGKRSKGEALLSYLIDWVKTYKNDAALLTSMQNEELLNQLMEHLETLCLENRNHYPQWVIPTNKMETDLETLMKLLEKEQNSALAKQIREERRAREKFEKKMEELERMPITRIAKAAWEIEHRKNKSR